MSDTNTQAFLVIMLFLAIYGGICYWLGRRSKRVRFEEWNDVKQELEELKKGYRKILKPKREGCQLDKELINWKPKQLEK